jgi:FkbM family methyltransferase
VATNGFSRQIVPLCLAMNDRSSLVTFKLGGLHAGNVGNEIVKGKKVGEGVPLTTASFSIDELFYIQGVTGINHLKIDVDGLELEILKGADKLLSDKFLKSILVEDNSGEKFEYSELFALIGKYGFKKSDEWGHDMTSNQIFTRS